MAIGIPAPGILPGTPGPPPGLASPMVPPPPPATPSQALQWLLAVASTLQANPMELAHMITTNADGVAAVLDAAGVPSPEAASGETADTLGPALILGSVPIDYAKDPLVEGGGKNDLSALGTSASADIPAGTSELDLTTPLPAAPATSVPGPLPEQQPGSAPPANAPPQVGTPLQQALTGLQMPPNPQVQPLATPSAPTPGSVDAASMNDIIAQVLAVAKPQASNLTLNSAVRS